MMIIQEELVKWVELLTNSVDKTKEIIYGEA